MSSSPEYMEAWRKKNAARLKSYSDEYRRAHREQAAQAWAAYYKKNAKRLRAAARVYAAEHRQRLSARRRARYQTDAEYRAHTLKLQHKSYERNKATHNARAQKYREAHREEIRAQQRANRKNWNIDHTRKLEMRRKRYAERMKFDPVFRITAALRVRTRQAIKGGSKAASTIELLGAPVEFVRGYLEAQFTNGMSWSNFGELWEIDHIKPCASFDLTKSAQQRECFHYSNIRPMLYAEHRERHARGA